MAKEPIAAVELDNAQSQATQAVYKNIEPTSGVGSPNHLVPSWTIFPNPTTGTLYFDGKHSMPGDYALQIIGTNGTVVLSKTISGLLAPLGEPVDVSKLATGNYFYRIVGQGEKVLGTGSFQKQ